MKIRLIWVGRTKEKWVAQAVEKYLAALKHMADVEVVEVREQKGRQRDEALAEEGRRILGLSSSFVLLDEAGVEYTSPGFAEFLGSAGARADFVIGGPYGVSPEVRKAARSSLSLSRMTMTHEMARPYFLEQLYRAFMIQQGRGYHH